MLFGAKSRSYLQAKRGWCFKHNLARCWLDHRGMTIVFCEVVAGCGRRAYDPSKVRHGCLGPSMMSTSWMHASPGPEVGGCSVLLSSTTLTSYILLGNYFFSLYNNHERGRKEHRCRRSTHYRTQVCPLTRNPYLERSQLIASSSQGEDGSSRSR